MTTMKPVQFRARRKAIAHSLALAAMLALGAGCATRPDVRSDQDSSVELASYKTFGFYATNESSPYATLLASRLNAAAREQLERRRFVYSEHEPDLRVNLRLAVDDRLQIRSSPTHRVGWRAGFGGDIETVEYRQGTLAIDLVDVKRNLLVWHAVAEGRLDTKAMEQPGPAIEAAVGEVFGHFPVAKTASATPLAADCKHIDSEIARTVEARRVAEEQSENAWKAVVPFVVLARKASAESSLEDADKSLAALKAQAQRCAPGNAR
jgi:hypothetical protein